MIAGSDDTRWLLSIDRPASVMARHPRCPTAARAPLRRAAETEQDSSLCSSTHLGGILSHSRCPGTWLAPPRQDQDCALRAKKLSCDMSSSGTPSTLLRAAREQAGLSQRTLARRAATTQSVVARIERGETSPGWNTLQRLLRAAGYDLEAQIVPRPTARSHHDGRRGAHPSPLPGGPLARGGGRQPVPRARATCLRSRRSTLSQ
jgi:DNA-binding XRE family transcriptional regulator